VAGGRRGLTIRSANKLRNLEGMRSDGGNDVKAAKGQTKKEMR
jgi:hypothetical protein